MKNTFLYLTCISFFSIFSAHAQTLEVRSAGEGGAQISTMIDTSLGLHQGNVWVWGFKGSGQQGNGIHDENRYRYPKKVEGLNNIVSVIGGAHHILAIDKNGYIYSWGQNIHGEAGCDGNPLKNYVLRPCKLKDNKGNILQGISQVVSAGEYHTVYMDKYGQVYTSGLYTLGRLGHGDYLAGGHKDARQPKRVNLQGEHARLIGAAYEGSFAITHEGNVWVWGDNEGSGLTFPGNGHLWVPTKSDRLKPYAKDIVAIGGGQRWGQALLRDGRVIAWGNRMYIGTSNRCQYEDIYSPNIEFVPVSKVKQISMRFHGSVALTEDNEIYTWGLGDGNFGFGPIYGYCPKKAPIPDSFTKQHGQIVKLGSGKEHVIYQMEDGTLWGMGYNAGGQLRDDAKTPITQWPGIQLRPIPYP